jgi:acetylornithine deacetylase/succinyl-diaminopimelate desuccinylase-like protein
MFYIHFDGQPVIPEEWAQENPFTPVVKERTGSGQWKAAGHSRH